MLIRKLTLFLSFTIVMYLGLEKKVVVITGSSRGLGREMVINFAEAGACVVINYNKSVHEASLLRNEIISKNANCLLVAADVSSEDDVKRFYKEVMNKYGRIDVLINNAGVTDDGYVGLMKDEQWNRVIRTNLTSVFLCSKYFSKNMIHRKNGKIINIASLKGQLGSEGQANYAASKAGMIGFTKSLAKELGKEGISVNAICPGYIQTDLNRNNTNKREIAKRMSAMECEFGMKDFLNFVMFLASDMLHGVSGQVFNIDSRIMN